MSSWDTTNVSWVRRLVLPLLALLVWTGTARAESVFAGTVTDARLVLGPNESPVVAYVSGGVLSIARRYAAGWSAASVDLPADDVEIDGLVVDSLGLSTVLLRERSGAWLALAGPGPTPRASWRWKTIFPDSKHDVIAPSGLALDKAGNPVVAYALWLTSRKTYLRLVRTDFYFARLVTTRITRGGFPSTATLPGAAPVVLPNGKIRVVETYLPAAIEWRSIPGDWLGQFLHSSALGVPVGIVAAGVSGSVVFAAWTEAYPTLGPPAVVVASHGTHAKSWVALEDAVLAALAVTPRGPELAANRCVPALAFGLEGNGICGGLVGASELDGVVAGFAVGSDGAHDVLLDDAAGLSWYRSPTSLGVQVTLSAAHSGDAVQLSGRVAGAGGGAVLVYRERPDEQRALVASVQLGVDGSFQASDTPPALPVAYRAVYVDAATGLPYAALLRQPVS